MTKRTKRVVQIGAAFEARPALGRRRVVEVVWVKLPAEPAEPRFEIRLDEIQFAGQTKEAEVVAVTPQREYLRALRAEMRVDGRPAAATPAGLKRRR